MELGLFIKLPNIKYTYRQHQVFTARYMTFETLGQNEGSIGRRHHTEGVEE
jgi:hypothetical protein